MSSPKGDKTPCARLCHIVKWDDFDGYGFNLHAEKGKNGQYIGKVDEGSPSQAAGLRQGDRIVEVNEINVANESHKQVVERIKAFPCETKLLVVDEEADEYFRANSIVIKGTMANVKVIKTPEKNPNSVEERSDIGSMDENTRKSTGSNDTSHSGSTATTTGVAATNAVNNNMTKEKDESSSSSTSSSSSSIREKNGNGNAMLRNEQQQSHAVHNNNTAAPTTMMMTAAGNGSVTGSEQQPPPRQGLNLKMSAKELRAQLAARKKYDPKKESIGFKDKFDIVQKL